MKRNLLDCLVKTLENTNPFGIYEGEVFGHYEHLKEAYLDVLLLLWNNFPRGFVDPVLFMCKYQHLTPFEAQRICRRNKVDDFIHCEMNDAGSTAQKDSLRWVLYILLDATCCPFEQEAFEQALCEFNGMLVRCEGKIRTLDGTVYRFTDVYNDNENENGNNEEQDYGEAPQGHPSEEPAEHSA